MNIDKSRRGLQGNRTEVHPAHLNVHNLTGFTGGGWRTGEPSRSSSETSLTLSPREVLSLISPAPPFPRRQDRSLLREDEGLINVSASEEERQPAQKNCDLRCRSTCNISSWQEREGEDRHFHTMGNANRVEDEGSDSPKNYLRWEDEFHIFPEEGDEYITASEDEDRSVFDSKGMFSPDFITSRLQARESQTRDVSSFKNKRANIHGKTSQISINGKVKNKLSRDDLRRGKQRKKPPEGDREKSLNSMGIKEKLKIDWSRAKPPERQNVLSMLHYRISNTINPDLKIFIKNTEFNCHKILLQCYSEYFDELFSKGDCSSINFNVEFKEVTKSAFVAIYLWMLSVDDPGFMLLNPHNILETLVACRALKVREMENQIVSFIENEELFGEEMAYFQYQRANQLGLDSVMKSMLPRIKAFFIPLVASKDFLELPLDDVMAFLSSDAILVHSEMEVFLSAIRWLSTNWEERTKHIVNLISCIRFGHMKPLEIVEIRNNPEFSNFMSNPEIQRFIDDGLALAVKKTLSQAGGDWIENDHLHPRNWHQDTKLYRSYGEFQEFLKQARANPRIMYLSMPVMNERGDNEGIPEPPVMLEHKSHYRMLKLHENNMCIPPKKKMFENSKEQKHGSVIAELMTRQKMGKPILSPMKQAEGSKYQHKKTISRRPSLQALAATIIQAHWRGYKARKRYNNTLSGKIPQLLLPARAPSPLSVILTPPKSVVTKPSVTSLPNQGSSSMIDNDMPLHEPFTNTSPSSTSESNTDPGIDQPNCSECVFIFGGLDPNSLVGPNNTAINVYRYVSSENSWEVISKMPSPRYYHGAAILKGRIYIAGGADPRKEETASQSSVTADVWSFDPTNTTWRVEPRLKTARKNFGLVAAHGALYAIGGQDKHDKVLNTVEKLEPQCGCWVEVSPLAEGRAGLAAAKYNHMIWVAGGVTAVGKQVITKSVECFDPKRNVWIPKPPLRTGRAFGAMVSLKGNLYIVGGAVREEGSASSTPSIDVWDEREKMWLLKTEMAVPRHGHTVSHIGNQLMVIGGSTTVYMKCLASVELWCTNECTWLRGACSVPGVITGHASVTVPLLRLHNRPIKSQQ